MPRRLLCVALTVAFVCVACGVPQRVLPADPMARARLLLDEGRLEQARDTALPLADSGGRDAVLLVAEIEMRRGQHADAATRLRRAVARWPEDEALSYALARALDGAGEGASDEALSRYGAWLKRHPGDAEAAMRMATLVLGRGDAAIASGLCAAALKANPDHAPLHALHAKILLARGRLPLALAAARRATELDPNAAEGWLQLARIQIVAGEHAEAIAALDKVVGLDPQHVEALSLLGRLHLMAGDAPLAVAMLRRAAAVARDDIPLLNLLAVALDSAGHAGEALEVLERAIALAPRLVLLRRNLAEILLGRGRLEAAHDEAASAFAIARDNSADDRGQAAERAAAEWTLARTIVARALLRAACAGDKDPDRLRKAIADGFISDGVTLTASSYDTIAAEVREIVAAAATRCRTKRGATP